MVILWLVNDNTPIITQQENPVLYKNETPADQFRTAEMPHESSQVGFPPNKRSGLRRENRHKVVRRVLPSGALAREKAPPL